MGKSKRCLTILLDHNDLACIEAVCPDALNGAVLVFDLDLHVHLLERGIEHLTPWDIVHRDDRKELFAFDAEVWRFWEGSAKACYGGIDCLDMARFRHMCCLSRLVWIAFVINKALAALKPHEVVTFEELVGHGLDQPPDNPKMPLLFALLRGMAEEAGIAVRLIRRTDIARQEAFVDRAALAASRTLEPVFVDNVLGDMPYVLFVGSRADLLRQLPLITSLRQRNDLSVVQLYKSATDAILDRILQEGHIVWHESQVTQDAVGDSDESWIADARSRFDDLRQNVSPPLRGIFANRYMDIHFDFIFGEYLRKMAWHINAWRGFLSRHRPRLVVSNHVAPILDVAGAMEIPCLLLPHGAMVMGNMRLYRGMPRSSKIGAISDAHQQRLLADGFEPDRVLVTGDPGLDDLIVTAGQSGDRFDRPGDNKKESWKGVDADRRTILLATTGVALAATTPELPEVDWKDAARCFEELAEVASRRPQWRFLIKRHPRRDHHQLYERANRRLTRDTRMIVVSDKTLEQLLPNVDVVVVPNTWTSAILEASFWPRPVYILQSSMIWVDFQVWALDKWPQLNSAAQLEQELDSIFNDPDRYRQRVRQTRDALHNYFNGPPTPSITRCVQIIEELVGEPAFSCNPY